MSRKILTHEERDLGKRNKEPLRIKASSKTGQSWFQLEPEEKEEEARIER